MNKHTPMSRRLRYGGTSAALTALIIAVVIVVNVIVSALGEKLLWYADLTPELLFTLTDKSVSILENGDEEFGSVAPITMVDEMRKENEDVSIRIIFCDDRDVWEQDNSLMLYIYQTARQMADKFPDHIKVENINSVKNPSAVEKYKMNSLSVINPTDVIVECGSEYRICSLDQFYELEEGDETPWAFKGERVFISAILAVTRVETPLACFVTGHSETYTDTALFSSVLESGFNIQELNLMEEEIPDDCRLLIIYNPQNDFKTVADGFSDIDEIDKIDKYLDEGNSMMVFMAPETKPLPILEEYLELWGIVFARDTVNGVTDSYIVEDKSQSLTLDGRTVVADYYYGTPVANLFDDMVSLGTEPHVIFKNAMPIKVAGGWETAHYPTADDKTDENTIPYDYAYKELNLESRAIYNLFVSGPSAEAYANGQVVEKATAASPLSLMTVSVRGKQIQEDNYGMFSVDASSYVFACGSVEFASQALLASSTYGNNEIMLSICAAASREAVPHGLTIKPFADLTIDTITTAQATQYTLVLTILPAAIALGAGIFILVRRKYR